MRIFIFCKFFFNLLLYIVLLMIDIFIDCGNGLIFFNIFIWVKFLFVKKNLLIFEFRWFGLYKRYFWRIVIFVGNSLCCNGIFIKLRMRVNFVIFVVVENCKICWDNIYCLNYNFV